MGARWADARRRFRARHSSTAPPLARNNGAIPGSRVGLRHSGAEKHSRHMLCRLFFHGGGSWLSPLSNLTRYEHVTRHKAGGLRKSVWKTNSIAKEVTHSKLCRSISLRWDVHHRRVSRTGSISGIIDMTLPQASRRGRPSLYWRHRETRFFNIIIF